MLGLGLGMAMFRGAGAAFTPASLSGLIADYNPDNGYVAGTSWADSSGTGNNLTLTGTTAGSLQNGHHTVSVANTDDANLASLTLGGAGALTYVAVFNGTTTAGANQPLISYPPATNNHRMYWHEASIGPAYWNGNNTALTGPAINGAWHILSSTDTGIGTGNVALLVDNVAVNPAVNGTGAVPTSGTAFNLFAATCSLTLARVLVYNRALSGTELTQLYNYLKSLYGI